MGIYYGPPSKQKNPNATNRYGSKPSAGYSDIEIHSGLYTSLKEIRKGLCLLSHTWSSWERLEGCKFKRYCKIDGCKAEQTKYEHDWGGWFYEMHGSCKLLRKCLRCEEIDHGSYKHEWTKWKYKSANSCRSIRKCLRCGFEDEGDDFHEWSNWKYKKR